MYLIEQNIFNQPGKCKLVIMQLVILRYYMSM